MGPEGSLGVRDDLFSTYALDNCFDEMFERAGSRARHTRPCIAGCWSCRPTTAQRQRDADSAFLQQGITFTVYGDDRAPSASFPTICCRAC